MLHYFIKLHKSQEFQSYMLMQNLLKAQNQLFLFGVNLRHYIY